ncbi:hypothetical protein Micbo1qcDRAFT_120035, partial [Microdochium bolleyi]
MADGTPQQSFGLTQARNAFVGNNFSGTTHFNINGAPACLRSLGFGEMHARRRDIVDAHPETCDWLFETPEFHDWRDPYRWHDHHGVLWIKGKPGVGKSTLMKHAFSHFHQTLFRDHHIVSYFFNARGSTLEKTPSGLLRSIVHQLLQTDDEVYNLFAPLFREKQMFGQESSWQWRLSELQEFVRSVVRTRSCSRPLLFLVDALDECDESDVRAVVDFLGSLSIQAFWCGCPLRICLSSRHYPRIKMDKVVELVVERCPKHQADVVKYIRDQLRIRGTKMETEILERAESVFLWVVIVVSLLNKAYDEGRVEAMRRTLEDIPDDMDKLFSAMLNNTRDAAETVRLIQWVLLSIRPLDLRELYAAAVQDVLPPDDLIEARITTSSRGLVEVRQDDSCSVQFIHLSVYDYLFRQKRLQTLDPTLGTEPIAAIHSLLWARCWSSIEQADTTNMSREHL